MQAGGAGSGADAPHLSREMNVTANYPPSPPPTYSDTFSIPSPRRTGLATTALVLGLLSIPTLCICAGPLLGLIAAVCGIIALVNANSKPALFGGAGRAVTGLVTGGFSAVLGCVVLPVVMVTGMAASIPVVRDFVHGFRSVASVHVIAAGLEQYYSDYSAHPTDLQLLVTTGKVPAGILPLPGDESAGNIVFVPDVGRQDPGDWIVAYARCKLMGREYYAVAYAGGGSDFLEKARFEAAWSQFTTAYTEARGKPPVAVSGEGAEAEVGEREQETSESNSP